MLDDAFEALKSYDWGADAAPLGPIDEAVAASLSDEAARKDLESRLTAVLDSDASRAAKDFSCRRLMVIGTAASAPTLAKMLGDEQCAHMARYALERIPGDQAGQALREALPKLAGALKIGVIASLGGRRDAGSTGTLTTLLGDADPAVAKAAAVALGHIASADAAKALAGGKATDAEVRLAATDGQLTYAESLLAEGKKAEALAVYQQVAKQEQPKHIRLAATRGMLACAGQSQSGGN